MPETSCGSKIVSLCCVSLCVHMFLQSACEISILSAVWRCEIDLLILISLFICNMLSLTDFVCFGAFITKVLIFIVHLCVHWDVCFVFMSNSNSYSFTLKLKIKAKNTKAKSNQLINTSLKSPYLTV